MVTVGTGKGYRILLFSSGHAIAGHNNDSVYIFGEDGGFLEVNPAYCNLLGYSREELLTLSIHDVETNISPEAIFRRIESFSVSGHARFKTSLCRKDGSMVDVEISATHVKVTTSPFEKGGLRGILAAKDTSLFLSIVRDITRCLMEEAEKASIVALAQSVQSKLEETLAAHAVASSNNVNLREQLFESNKYLEWRHHHKNRFCGQGFQNHPNHCRRFRHWHCLGIPGKNL